MSSSVTPPNNTPIDLADQFAIVHPDRKDGAYPTFFLFSHLNESGGPGAIFEDLLVDGTGASTDDILG